MVIYFNFGDVYGGVDLIHYSSTSTGMSHVNSFKFLTVYAHFSSLHNSSMSVLTARRYAKRGICRNRVSVCVSVTLRYCIKMAKCRITQITPHDSPVTLVF